MQRRVSSRLTRRAFIVSSGVRSAMCLPVPYRIPPDEHVVNMMKASYNSVSVSPGKVWGIQVLTVARSMR